MAKRKTAIHKINGKLHRGTAMDHKLSSQTWGHKIEADGTFLPH